MDPPKECSLSESAAGEKLSDEVDVQSLLIEPRVHKGHNILRVRRERLSDQRRNKTLPSIKPLPYASAV
jgi:hypothetical protein